VPKIASPLRRKPVYNTNMQDIDLATKMRREWDERARANFRHYIADGRRRGRCLALVLQG